MSLRTFSKLFVFKKSLQFDMPNQVAKLAVAIQLRHLKFI